MIFTHAEGPSLMDKVGLTIWDTRWSILTTGPQDHPRR
jgi:hypothetical protein